MIMIFSKSNLLVHTYKYYFTSFIEATDEELKSHLESDKVSDNFKNIALRLMELMPEYYTENTPDSDHELDLLLKKYYDGYVSTAEWRRKPYNDRYSPILKFCHIFTYNNDELIRISGLAEDIITNMVDKSLTIKNIISDSSKSDFDDAPVKSYIEVMDSLIDGATTLKRLLNKSEDEVLTLDEILNSVVKSISTTSKTIQDESKLD